MAAASDPLKDEIISTLHGIGHRVTAIEETLAKMEKVDASLLRKGVSCAIESGIGKVVVDGSGDLVQVQLNANSIASSDSAKLGTRVVAAVRLAQNKANDLRNDLIDELAREMW